MTSLAERLRGVLRPTPVGAEGTPLPPPTNGGSADLVQPPDAAAEVLGGVWLGADSGRFLVVDRQYAPDHRHGHWAVSHASNGIGDRRGLRLLAGGEVAAERLLFLDLETTGLAGGAGTYAFLVGCGWFEPASAGASGELSSFRIRQFFLSSFGAERSLLAALEELAGGVSAVVTFNGKTFDLPLIENRFLLHRRATPFAELPHLDMLHPARRLWRSEEQESGCRLAELEQTLLGHRRHGDVPGFDIPARYFRYVRSGDARPLEAVFEHNRLDLLSLAWLTTHAARMLEEGPAAARSAREAVGLGRLYERGGLAGEASACYWRGAELPGDAAAQAEALRGYAVIARRERRYREAADAWRRILDLRRCPPAIVREAAEALAVHHEHRVRDLEVARRFALHSLSLQAGVTRRQAIQHRLARINRKLGFGQEAALF